MLDSNPVSKQSRTTSIAASPSPGRSSSLHTSRSWETRSSHSRNRTKCRNSARHNLRNALPESSLRRLLRYSQTFSRASKSPPAKESLPCLTGRVPVWTVWRLGSPSAEESVSPAGGCVKRRCSSSAACWCSLGRSRTSGTVSPATITCTWRNAPLRAPSMSIRPSRGSTGIRASRRPVRVSRTRSWRRRGLIAPSSCSTRRPSLIWDATGASTNGKFSISPSPAWAIWRMTVARLVRRISGSVNSGRELKSSSL